MKNVLFIFGICAVAAAVCPASFAADEVPVVTPEKMSHDELVELFTKVHEGEIPKDEFLLKNPKLKQQYNAWEKAQLAVEKNSPTKKIDDATNKLEEKREGTVSRGTKRKGVGSDKGKGAGISRGGTGSFGLPRWDDPEFDPSLDPLFGQQFGRKTVGTKVVNSLSLELGAEFGLKNIPVWSEGVQLFVSTRGGGARGSQSSLTTAKLTELPKESDKSVAAENHLNSRKWYGGDLELYYDFYRQKIGLDRAQLDFDDFQENQLKSLAKTHEFGFKILGYVSLWHSYREYHAFHAVYERPLVSEVDHHFHGQLAVPSINMTSDIGAGFSKVDVYNNPDTELRSVAGAGLSRTLRWTTKFSLGESFRFESFAKYAYAADAGLADAYNRIRLPSEKLNAAPLIMGTPQDTFTGRAFAGWVDLIDDLTLGYAYNIDVANAKSSDKKSTERTAGPLVEYSYSF